MIDRNHPAVEAANRAVKRAYGSRGGEALAYHATALRAAFPHLTADDLRHTPVGQQLLADGWTQCADHVALKAVGLSESLHHQNPHRS